LDESPRRVEGKRNGKWVLMDYFNTIVHVFDEETRDFFAIEQLWGDGEFTRIQD
jgi:ribosome-associated protein